MAKDNGYHAKEGLLEELEKVQVKHARGEEYLNKAKRYDDCFGMNYDANEKHCQCCNIRTVYEGVERSFGDLCKLFMSEPIFKNGDVKKTEIKKRPEKKRRVAADVVPADEVPEEKKKRLSRLIASSRMAMKDNIRLKNSEKEKMYRVRMDQAKVEMADLRKILKKGLPSANQ